MQCRNVIKDPDKIFAHVKLSGLEMIAAKSKWLKYTEINIKTTS